METDVRIGRARPNESSTAARFLISTQPSLNLARGAPLACRSPVRPHTTPPDRLACSLHSPGLSHRADSRAGPTLPLVPRYNSHPHSRTPALRPRARQCSLGREGGGLLALSSLVKPHARGLSRQTQTRPNPPTLHRSRGLTLTPSFSLPRSGRVRLFLAHLQLKLFLVIWPGGSGGGRVGRGAVPGSMLSRASLHTHPSAKR